LALQIGHEHLAVRAELCQYLTAEATGRHGLKGVGDDRQGSEVSSTCSDGLKDRHSLGTDGGPKGGVLNVAPGKDLSI
jgi:hypothetical protein